MRASRSASAAARRAGDRQRASRSAPVTCGCPAIREGAHASLPACPTPRAASRAPRRASPPARRDGPRCAVRQRAAHGSLLPRRADGRAAPASRSASCATRPDAEQTACVGPAPECAVIPSPKSPPIPRTSPCAVRRLTAAADVVSCAPRRAEREASAGDGRGARLDGSGLIARLRPRARPRDAPGAQPALDLMAMIPVAGPILAVRRGRSAARRCTSPVERCDGVTLLGTWQHEAGAWATSATAGSCGASLTGSVPNVRAGAERPATPRTWPARSPSPGPRWTKVEAGALGALANHGLDEPALPRAARSCTPTRRPSAREDPGGIIADSLAALRAVRWRG